MRESRLLATSDAEKRHLTVMFCDIVESTALSKSMDIEDWGVLITEFQNAITVIVERFGGSVAQYLGDGTLVYFGYPTAFDDNAKRAIRAALEISVAVTKNRLALPRQTVIQVRIGIHSGPVVIGAIGRNAHHETLATGDTPHLAARLQALAKPNEILTSYDTRVLVGEEFSMRDVGTMSLKGYSDEVRVFSVNSAIGSPSVMGQQWRYKLIPLVARENEFGIIEQRWLRATGGWGQIVSLRGDAGIGKSRLIEAFREGLPKDSCLWLDARGSAQTENSALHPIVELQRQALQINVGDTRDTKQHKIRQNLNRIGLHHESAIELLSSLHGLAPINTLYGDTLTASGRRKQTIDLLTDWTERFSHVQPLVLVIEDLHWIDPSSLEFLRALIPKIPQSKLFLLMTFRPSFEPQWEPEIHQRELSVSRLKDSEIDEIVTAIDTRGELPETMHQAIVARSDGVPLFAEELSYSALDATRRDWAACEDTSVPTVLQDPLMARLDNLGSIRDLALLSSVVGREFTYQLIRAVAQLPEADLRAALKSAVDAGLYYERGSWPNTTYLFRHQLIRDAAYQTLMRSTRQRYHASIARALIDLPEIARQQPELVAEHFSAASSYEAIYWWLSAGLRAMTRCANAEAIAHFDRGLALKSVLPDKAQPSELDLCLPRAQALSMRIGWGSPETLKAWKRCEALCAVQPNAPELLTSLDGLWSSYLSSGLLSQTADTGQRLVQAGRELEVPLFESLGSAAQTAVALFSGDVHKAIRICEKSMNGTIPPTDIPIGSGGHGSIMAWAAWVYAIAGDLHQSKSLDRENIENDEPDLYRVAHKYVWCAISAMLRRDYGASLNLGNRALGICDEQGFIGLQALGALPVNWSRAMAGDIAAIGRFADAADAVTAVNKGGAPWIACLLAELHGHHRLCDTIKMLDRASELSKALHQPFYDAEIARFRGRSAKVRGDTENAFTYFVDARQIARKQHARLFELRACSELVRLNYRTIDCDLRNLESVLGQCTGLDDFDIATATSLLSITSREHNLRLEATC